MKKAVKSLVVAASIAAIAGIGAVSFAKWSGGSTTTLSSENTATGTMEAVGFDTGTSFTAAKALMPYDQPSDNLNGGETYWQADLVVNGTDLTGYSIKVKAEAADGETLPTGLLYHVKSESDSAPSVSTDITGWTALNGTESTVVSTSDIANKTYTVYIILNSSNGDSYTANAGKNFTITFTLAAPTT